MRRSLAGGAGMIAALVLAGPSVAQTLPDAIGAAWETNPELAAARARQDALAETPAQAQAAGRLTSESRSDLGYDRLGNGKAATAGLAATLPVWTGGRVASATRAARSDVAAGAAMLRDVEAAVLERVVGAYADLLYNQQAVEVARVGIERLDRQRTEARSRFALGQATQTDVAQLDAQRASVAANLADAEGALAVAQAAYVAVVGRASGALSAEVPTSPLLPRTLEEAREAAESANPVLLAQRRTTDAAMARINQARADRMPSVALSGTYGRGLRLGDSAPPGFESAASVGATLRVPLLLGGLTASRIRQAQATWRAERFQTQAAAREASRGADAAWAQLIAAHRRLDASLQGLTAADLALRGVRAEYGFGLRSTIDILVADQSLRSAQLDVARARADVLIAQAALLRATGRLQPDAYR